jgi:peptidoglycan/xylan/chitin deacetylase (PgdA/CDA1 family)
MTEPQAEGAAAGDSKDSVSAPGNILILNIARPRKRPVAKAAAPYTDFSPRPRFVVFLTFLLRLLGYRLVTLTEALRAPAGKYACLTFDGANPEVHSALFPQLRRLRIPATIFVATRSVLQASRDIGTSLGWAELRQLVASGWDVGSLGHEPVDLTERSYLEQKRQIARSRSLLTAHLGKAPRLFAYPFGAYDATTLSCLKEEGFTAAVTMRKGSNAIHPEPFQLKRLALSSSTVRDVGAVLRHALFSRSPAAAANAMRAGAERESFRTGAAL